MTALDTPVAASAPRALPLPAGLRADPLADRTIAAILQGREGSSLYETIGLVNRLIAQWQTNGGIAAWEPQAGVPADIADALRAYLREGAQLPAWADAGQIGRAEELFMDMSMLSCTLLFCASLPECYVIPDLSAVLHISGQLEDHCDYRVRSTAAMIFPVMMKGGLTSPEGGGVAQALKVRLIHATIRHLILRGEPDTVLRAGRDAIVPALPAGGPTMHHALFAHGWDIGRSGLPCNQEELAYTLLTFHYVFLRGLRTLGLPLPAQDEEAYLHAWNVLGHVIGIEREYMTATMAESEKLFARLQANGRAHPWLPDARPALGRALMQVMADEIPLPFVKSFPVLLTRRLCGKRTARDLGLDGRVPVVSRVLFALCMGLVRGIDTLVRLFLPQFSISRLVTRIAGYNFTVKVLMDQTRPLKLPESLLNQVDAATRNWHHDAKAPRWMNAVEEHFTGRKKRRDKPKDPL
jgi:hypothetical protein